MDPLETLRLAACAASEGRWTDARECLNDYSEWRVRKGFEPTTPSGMKGDNFEAKVRAACYSRSAESVPVF
jgi:hypothetical protein